MNLFNVHGGVNKIAEHEHEFEFINNYCSLQLYLLYFSLCWENKVSEFQDKKKIKRKLISFGSE